LGGGFECERVYLAAKKYRKLARYFCAGRSSRLRRGRWLRLVPQWDATMPREVPTSEDDHECCLLSSNDCRKEKGWPAMPGDG
jgi:hypothetical protein